MVLENSRSLEVSMVLEDSKYGNCIHEGWKLVWTVYGFDSECRMKILDQENFKNLNIPTAIEDSIRAWLWDSSQVKFEKRNGT